MKKLLGFLMVLGLAGHAYAISPVDEDDNVLIHYTNTSVTASTDVILVDLSSATGYKLSHDGFINISRIKTVIDTVASSTGSVKIGVVNHVNASTGSVSYFFECPLYNHGATTNIIKCDELYSPTLLKTKITAQAGAAGGWFLDGVPDYFATSDTTSGSTLFQTDVNLLTALAVNEAPAVGDIILSIVNGSGNQYDLVVDVFYHAKR